MRSRGSHVCAFIPPHMLRRLAERGDEAQRETARATLEASSRLRSGRASAGGSPAIITRPGGERTVFDARHFRTLPGSRVRGEGDPKAGDPAVDEAYEGCGRTHQFFQDVFGRNSLDDRGMSLNSTVHFGRSFCNVQWDGRQMIYGDGDSRLFNRFTQSLDIIAHELAHAVTQFTARLDYHGEAGALNEHMSDVFASLVRQYELRQSAARADWLIGAGLFTSTVHGEAVRSMKAPGTAYDDPLLGKDPQPAHMRDYVHAREDNGGVHINSGIPNRAFYLAARAIGGNAWSVAGRIWYLALTRKLEPSSTFHDCADATFIAAGELYGEGSEPQRAVHKAWTDVGVVVASAIAARMRLPVRAAAIEMPQGGAEVPFDCGRPLRPSRLH